MVVVSEGPRIYVACLASYNQGILHGLWIDADQDAEIIREEVNDMLKGSPVPGAEEHAIHDHEGFHPYRVREYESIDDVATIARGIREHGKAFPALLNYLDDLQEAMETMEEGYHGEWSSLEEYVEDYYRSCHEVPESLEYYVDWAAMARDMRLNGEVFSVECDRRVYVFSS